MQPENARSNNIELHVEEDKLAMPEFKALWSRINAKSVYVVDFDTNELIKKSIAALNSKLHVSKIYFQVVSGTMNQIKSKDDLISGASFVREESNQYGTHISASNNVKYDLVGKLVDETGLTRKAIVQILQGIQPAVFNQFKDNPEEFIIRAADLINDEKATAIIQHITYNALDEHYETYLINPTQLKEVSIMTTIKYAASGEQRKKLVNALSEVLECESKHLKAPSYGYEVGLCVVNRAGDIEFPNDMTEEEVEAIEESRMPALNMRSPLGYVQHS